MKEAGYAIRGLERQTTSAGTALRRAGHHGFWFNQVMFTTRRTVYGLTLGLGALGAGAAVMGFRFQNTMEQNTLAFTRFLGSAGLADQELAHLFELAARTPFEFTQIVDATRKFLAFGFTLEETNDLLAVTADAVAGFGLSAEAIDRAVLALGQMRSAGRILGQDLRQLQELGLFSPDDFQRRLNLPSGWLGNVGNLQIDAKSGIDAITAYWREKFGGASADFATTFQGQLTTLRDYGSRTFGAMIEPLFTRLSKDVLPLMIEITTAAQEGFESGGFRGFFKAIDDTAGVGTNLAGVWTTLTRGARSLWSIVKPLGEAFLFAFNVLSPSLAVFNLLFSVMDALGGVLQLLIWPLKILITLWVVERTVLLAATIVGWRHVAMRVALRLWTMAATKAQMLYNIAQITNYAWTKRQIIADYLLITANTWLTRSFKVLNIWLRVAAASMIWLTLAMLRNPWVAATVGLLIFLQKMGYLADAAKALREDLQKIKEFLEWMGRGKADLKKQAGSTPLLGIDFGDLNFGFPGLARGGVVSRGGYAMVGEKGPEVGWFPKGAMVQPLDRPGLLGAVGEQAFGRGGDIVIPITLEMDSRVIATKTVRHKQKVEATS